jgi:hypothetical protein
MNMNLKIIALVTIILLVGCGKSICTIDTCTHEEIVAQVKELDEKNKAWDAAHKGDDPFNVGKSNVTEDAGSLDRAYGSRAESRCTDGADDFLKTYGTGSFKWDEIGSLDERFDKFVSVTHKPGVLVLTSNKISLQNGFGGFDRTVIYCEYDTQAMTVLSYKVDAGITG